MAHRTTLTEAQLDLLRWIADGSPPGIVDGTSYRISAAALRSRGLINVTGRGDTWAATVTPAGTALLDASAKPGGPPPRQANGSVTQQLVDDLIAAGGSLVLPRPDGRKGSIDYEKRARAAEQHGKVPAGKRLAITRVSHDQIRIDLVDGPTRPDRPDDTVAVPAKVASYHRLVRAYRDDNDLHEVTRTQLPRALRILHTLITAAEARGMTVTGATPTRDEYGRTRWSSTTHGHLTIAADGCTTSFRFLEVGLANRAWWFGEHSKYDPDKHAYAKPTVDEYEAGGTGKLRLEILGYHHGASRQARWTDSRRGALEDHLDDILWEINLRGIERQERIRQAEADAEAAERDWQIAMGRARQQHAEQHRATILLAQVERWREVSGIRVYCDAIDAAHPDSVSADWVTWARNYADRIDPLPTPPTIPNPPTDVSPSELKPYLGRWDPYGPPARPPCV